VTPASPLDRLRELIERHDLTAVVLSHPESVANVCGYSAPAEDYPVAHPFVSDPAMLLVTESRSVLVVADAYSSLLESVGAEPLLYRSYDYLADPDPVESQRAAVAQALTTCDVDHGRVGVEPGWLPTRLADALRAQQLELLDIEAEIVAQRRIKSTAEIEALRTVAGLADAAQRAVKQNAQAGLTEAELAGFAQVAMNRLAGIRVPTFLNLTTGPASATPPWEPTGRQIQAGDIILTDVAPWFGGAWGDSANAIVVGSPQPEHVRVFDALRRALETGIAAARPGAVARDVDAAVRESLLEFGDYPHHTGHALGASWSEEPRLTPYNAMQIEEGMVLAVEPAVYRPGWGGMRLEHMFLVGARENEILTQFEHTL
jgi:Xaa-Pro aminopeptidase